MTTRLTLPTIAPCPCGKSKCKVAIVSPFGKWRAVSDCGWAGPARFAKRTAREAWNRRASDAEAERRLHKLAELWSTMENAKLDNGSTSPWVRAFNALETEMKKLCGEVLPAKGKRA